MDTADAYFQELHNLVDATLRLPTENQNVKDVNDNHYQEVKGLLARARQLLPTINPLGRNYYDHVKCEWVVGALLKEFLICLCEIHDKNNKEVEEFLHGNSATCPDDLSDWRKEAEHFKERIREKTKIRPANKLQVR